MRLPLFLFVSVALVEIGLGFAWFATLLSSTSFLIGHGLVMALLALIWQFGRGADLRIMPFGFIGVLFTGPMGAAGLVLLALHTVWTKPDTQLLDEWYQKLAGSREREPNSLLYRSISSQRAVGSCPSTVRNFGKVVSDGSLKDKQALLGMIAVKYHPDFFHLLQTALRDSEPVVRVQAAAAYAKLRQGFRKKLIRALVSSPLNDGDQHSPSEKIAILKNCIGSGFLEKSEIKLAQTAIRCQVDDLSQIPMRAV